MFEVGDKVMEFHIYRIYKKVMKSFTSIHTIYVPTNTVAAYNHHATHTLQQQLNEVLVIL